MLRHWIPERPRAARSLAALLLALAGTAATLQAQAATISAGPLLTAVPAGLVDPVGNLSLGASQFLVPVQVQGASDLDLWQFSLQYDASVAALADAGGLFQSVYQSDFGGGAISQITGSGLGLSGLLQDVSGYFAPGVSGDGVLAYVLFAYLPGHEGQDPVFMVPGTPTGDVPEPSTLALLLAAAGVAAWSRLERCASPTFIALERI